jgi:hypothetical protein
VTHGRCSCRLGPPAPRLPTRPQPHW